MLQRETGGNLAEILDNCRMSSGTLQIQRQVRVYTAQDAHDALLMAMPPIIVTIMLVLNPSFIRPLFADPIDTRCWWLDHSANDRLFRDPQDHSDSGLVSRFRGLGLSKQA